jgi:hypothetical protein
MRKNHIKKGLTLVIIALFIGLSSNPSTGNNMFFDDTTPPVTTHSLNPPEPDGLNGWYVSDLNVTLNATDDSSGVKEIKYKINDGPVQTIPGESGSFKIRYDGEDIFIEYWAIDNAGNIETTKSFLIDMDQTVPEIELVYEAEYDPVRGWIFIFTATAVDLTSGIDRVEFYLDEQLQETVYGTGPYYEWIWEWNFSYEGRVVGLIRNPEITEKQVKFYAIFVIIKKLTDLIIPVFSACAYDKAGNWAFDEILPPCNHLAIHPGIHIFKSLTLPNNYTGYIGKNLIYAKFDF